MVFHRDKTWTTDPTVCNLLRARRFPGNNLKPYRRPRRSRYPHLVSHRQEISPTSQSLTAGPTTDNGLDFPKPRNLTLVSIRLDSHRLKQIRGYHFPTSCHKGAKGGGLGEKKEKERENGTFNYQAIAPALRLSENCRQMGQKYLKKKKKKPR
ncbi:hypothetical protein BDV26DRAFT_271115 [Aspergillus bertholletiae]|uniref:Uncharacterized protein n=1 Tax=Aspergillus bertholletiae TaxID=1226010 RepID=A0A5N7AVS6_9EURO|nr:hypothetical protein BDV26DRAFT_271115 [Aspergillus bertholletiae]